MFISIIQASQKHFRRGKKTLVQRSFWEAKELFMFTSNSKTTWHEFNRSRTLPQNSSTFLMIVTCTMSERQRVKLDKASSSNPLLAVRSFGHLGRAHQRFQGWLIARCADAGELAVTACEKITHPFDVVVIKLKQNHWENFSRYNREISAVFLSVTAKLHVKIVIEAIWIRAAKFEAWKTGQDWCGGSRARRVPSSSAHESLVCANATTHVRHKKLFVDLGGEHTTQTTMKRT